MIVAKGQLVLLLLLSNVLFLNANANLIIPKSKNSRHHNDVQEILTNTIYDEILKRSEKLLPLIKKKESNKQGSVNEGKRGRMIIEEMKQRNREKLALMRGVDPSKVKSGADIVKMQQSNNKELIQKINELSKSDDWRNLAVDEIKNLKKKMQNDFLKMKKKYLPTLKEWEKKRKGFSKNIKNYKEGLEDIPLVLPVSKEDQKKEIQATIKKEFKLTGSSLGIKVRDQSARPTCAAFAGIRAVEVMLAQNDKARDLSEQYFYWASKPKCRTSKCNERGSWVGHGLNYSKKARGIDIPTESKCPYQKFSKRNNETQIPLSSGCDKGSAKVKEFEYFKNLDGVITSLDQDKPVTLGIKLTPNFYKNKGLVLYSERNAGGKLDSHSQGHMVLIVGYMKLPQILDEGKVCFIVANSWGLGWGQGGHACLSEKWVRNQRNRNPFVSLSSIETSY